MENTPTFTKSAGTFLVWLSGYLAIWLSGYLAIWLLVVLSAFREGFGFDALCLFMPPYLLFYTIAHMESPVLRGVFYGILFSIISEIYLMREHSILLAIGSAINEFIRHVDELIKHANQGPM